MISIPSDLRKNKDTIVGNMDLRECICLFLGLLLALGILYYIRVVLGYKRIVIAAFIAGIFIIPFLFIGFKKIHGMRIDDYFKVFVNNKIIANSCRLNICECTELDIKDKKYELLRYYRIMDKEEIIDLRQYLLDKKILILTELVNYNNDKIAIFRLDGKDLILEQIQRNKASILNLKSKIREFINNELKPAKHLRKQDKEDIVEFKNSKKSKILEIENRIKSLKREMKYLQAKTFNELKNEVNIFESIGYVKAERMTVNIQNGNSEPSDNGYISNLRKAFSEDSRTLIQLHLFNKNVLNGIFKKLDDTIVFINNEGEVDIYTFGANFNDDVILDFDVINNNEKMYATTILSLEARNEYKHYRKIKDIEEVL